MINGCTKPDDQILKLFNDVIDTCYTHDVR